MRFHLRILASLFTLLIAVLSNGNIFQRTLSNAMAESTEAHRPLLILFTSASCEPCRAIESYLQQEDIQAALDRKYVAAHVDIADFDGKACSQIYGVSQTPSFVVASPEGEVLFRKDGGATTGDIQHLLTGELNNVVEPDATTTKAAPQTAQGSSGNYAIQLGFFSSHDNAVKLRDKARKRGYNSTYIKDEQRNGKQYYRVLVGRYPDQSHAQATMTRLDKDGFPAKLHEHKS